MASFEAIDYSVRPNKAVERKLIFELLQFLRSTFKLQEYQYVGLGSMWFVDFMMAHRLLQIESLISIERNEYAPRAAFNAPYRCIEVIGGDTTTVLPELDWERKSIVWLDYDSSPIDGPIFSDLDYLAGKAGDGTFIIVTANAHPGRLSEVDGDGNKLSRVAAAREAFSRYVKDSEIDSTASGYPKMVAKALLNQITSSVIRSGRAARFLPLFNFWYRDNSPMVTVGGLISTEASAERLQKTEVFSRFPYATGCEQYKIVLPHLTSKEKAAIDSQLPAPDQLTSEAVEGVLGFRLSQSQLDGYQRFYRLYPTFAELSL